MVGLLLKGLPDRFARLGDRNLEELNRLGRTGSTSIHGSDDAFDLEKRVALVGDHLVATLHLLEVEDHRRAIGIFLEHL